MLAERRRDEIKRADRRAGEVVAILYNINRNTDSDRAGKDWDDFFPEWKEMVPQTEDDMYQAMLMWSQTKLLPS